jgi:argininosuccinate synthase
MPRMIYNGYWWSPRARCCLQALIDESQRPVNGKVRVKLYKGNVSVVGDGRSSDESLFDAAHRHLRG